MLPRDIIRLLADLLPFQDVVSLSQVNKEYYLTLDDSYWQRRVTIPRRSYLSWKGLYVLELTQEKETLVRGSENFASMDILLIGSYQSGDDSLLDYFIRVILREKRMCYHSIKGRRLVDYQRHRSVLCNLLTTCLLDKREKTFLVIWKYKKVLRITERMRLSLYILAREKGLRKTREALRIRSLVFLNYAVHYYDKEYQDWYKPLCSWDMAFIDDCYEKKRKEAEIRSMDASYLRIYPGTIWGSIIDKVLSYDHEGVRDSLSQEGWPIEGCNNPVAYGLQVEAERIHTSAFYLTIPNLGCKI